MTGLLPQFVATSLFARFVFLPETRPVGRFRVIALGISQGIAALLFLEWSTAWFLTVLALVLVPIVALWLCEIRCNQENSQLRLVLLLFQMIVGALWCARESALLQTPAIIELFPSTIAIWLSGALLCAKESNLLVRIFFSRLRNQFAGDGTRQPTRDTTGNGRIIGSLERLLVYVFLLGGHSLAVSAVIAVKALARFKRMEEDQGFAEYVIIGTFLSLLLTLAIIGGVQGCLR